MKITKEQLYLRQTTLDEIGENGQEKLQDAEILIVGCGGLGSVAAVYLAASGVGNIHLIDFDVVSILEDSIKGEQCAISIYSQLAEMTKDKDIVTYDIVSEILADEVEHEEDLQSLHDDITEFVADIKKKID